MVKYPASMAAQKVETAGAKQASYKKGIWSAKDSLASTEYARAAFWKESGMCQRPYGLQYPHKKMRLTLLFLTLADMKRSLHPAWQSWPMDARKPALRYWKMWVSLACLGGLLKFRCMA